MTEGQKQRSEKQLEILAAARVKAAAVRKENAELRKKEKEIAKAEKDEAKEQRKKNVADKYNKLKGKKEPAEPLEEEDYNSEDSVEVEEVPVKKSKPKPKPAPKKTKKKIVYVSGTESDESSDEEEIVYVKPKRKTIQRKIHKEPIERTVSEPIPIDPRQQAMESMYERMFKLS